MKAHVTEEWSAAAAQWAARNRMSQAVIEGTIAVLLALLLWTVGLMVAGHFGAVLLGLGWISWGLAVGQMVAVWRAWRRVKELEDLVP
jgi:hypothetical protein